jgi:deoxyribodipyrimidine photo-lyase
MRSIVWFRGKDLRLEDHEALHSALSSDEIIPLFVLDPYFFEPKQAAKLPHRMQFLLQSLEALRQALAVRGSQLIIRRGRSIDVVPEMAAKWGADQVLAQRWSEPFARRRDQIVSSRLGCKLVLFEGETLVAPGTIKTQQGAPYSVFTPFSKRFLAQTDLSDPRPAPSWLPPLPASIQAQSESIPNLADLGLTTNTNVLLGGAAHADQRMRLFVDQRVMSYPTARNRPDQEGTSRLGPDLKFGTLSPRQVWHAAQTAHADAQTDSFRRQLIWREFAHDLIWNQPQLLEQPFRKAFIGFPWKGTEDLWTAWVEGRTGYPIVDASARQLLATGFIDNRARMIAASFLTKHLLIDYRRGEAHYMKWLTDGDWAANNFGWQWSAGCGCDAQPYFRVFNPILQGKKFDPKGLYVRRWVPEIRELPNSLVHTPWLAPQPLANSLYPAPIVDHPTARKRFLATAKEFMNKG